MLNILTKPPKLQSKITIFCGGNILIWPNNQDYLILTSSLLPLVEMLTFVEYQNQLYCTVSSTKNLPEHTSQTFKNHTTNLEVLRVYQWLRWNEQTRFCSLCTGPMQRGPQSLSKTCQKCQTPIWPALPPAILVLIERDDQILLARGPQFAKGVYSCLAGFIDIGESAEDAVHREVMEETGLEIDNIRYFGSQSWPFPGGSFMIGFIARYKQGTLKIDQNELEDAKWFYKNQLPKLPSPLSLSCQIIKAYQTL